MVDISATVVRSYLLEARMPWLVAKFDRGREGGRDRRNNGERGGCMIGGGGLFYLFTNNLLWSFLVVWHFFHVFRDANRGWLL